MIADTLTLEIANGINDRSARGIATAIGRMISSGELVIGAQLPTVRQLSRQLGVSPPLLAKLGDHSPRWVQLRLWAETVHLFAFPLVLVALAAIAK